MKFLAVIAVALAGIWGLTLALANPSYSYRYRLTLEVEVNGQLHTGSSVVQVDATNAQWTLNPGMRTAVRGEATIVDLGSGRILAALLVGDPEAANWPGQRQRGWIGPNPANLLARLYGVRGEWADGRNPALAEFARQRGVKDLRWNELPTLVSFRDAADPRSIFVVNPENFSQSLGAGVRLSRATIEITEAATTSGIERTLRWLPQVKNYISGKPYCDAPRDRPADLPFCPQREHFVRHGLLG